MRVSIRPRIEQNGLSTRENLIDGHECHEEGNYFGFYYKLWYCIDKRYDRKFTLALIVDNYKGDIVYGKKKTRIGYVDKKYHYIRDDEPSIKEKLLLKHFRRMDKNREDPISKAQNKVEESTSEKIKKIHIEQKKERWKREERKEAAKFHGCALEQVSTNRLRAYRDARNPNPDKIHAI